jgi:glutaryl-CoA dehydrogenase (non-decarboxylating)
MVPKDDLIPRRAEFRDFVDRELATHARAIDESERLPVEVIAKLAARGYFSSGLSETWGAPAFDMTTCGVLHEEVGRGCSSARSLLTVQGMVVHAVRKWGTEAQRHRWLPRLCQGIQMAAFALSEPDVGSDAKAIAMSATPTSTGFRLNGSKRWTSFGQIANLFLIFARCEGMPTAFLVDANSMGLTRKRVSGLLGLRGSMVADLELNNCDAPRDNMLGRPGFGISHVAATALAFGRFSVASGCAGITDACLNASVAYAQKRRQFGALLAEQQLVRRLISRMFTDLRASRLLCADAAARSEGADSRWFEATFLAKYFASEAAMTAATDAVQIHGAVGCSAEYPVARFFRDAKIMQIIEGSTQIQENTIAEFAMSGGRDG